MHHFYSIHLFPRKFLLSSFFNHSSSQLAGVLFPLMKTNGLPEMKKTDNIPDSKDPDEKINTDKELAVAVPDRRDKELIPPQQQGHIEFASSSSFSNQNSEEFNPISAPVAHGGGGGRGGGHIELRSSSSFSNYRSSTEFKPSRSYKNGHIEFGSSSSFSNHNSIEFKHPPKHKERAGEESPARSSISSDRNNTGEEDGKLESKTVKISDNTPGMVSRPVKEQPAAPSKKADAGSASVGEVEVGGGGGGNSQRKNRPSLSILRKTKREQMVKKTGLAFRVFGALFCLVSFSILAMDRNKGWALDSFDRYKEFRYCMAVNVIGFTYSVAQISHLGYMLATGKSTAMAMQQQHHHLRYYFDFTFDQMVTYLLISASSSAATRIDDWKSNWGSDMFPDMATAAVSMSFLAFLALAFTSLNSGYALCISKSA